MRIAKILCPYCNKEQKFFHLSYELKKFFNIFPVEEQLIPTRFFKNNNKEIKKLDCKSCSKGLVYFFDVSKQEYFIDGEMIKYARDLIKNKINGINSIKDKIIKLERFKSSDENQKILEYLRIKMIKEDEAFNHLKEEYKDLPLNL